MLGLHPTHEIGHKASQTIYYTRAVAEWQKLPLNYEVTINYASTALDPRKAVSAFSELRKRFSKWATRKKPRGPIFAPTYTYALENVRDGRPFMTMEPGDQHNVHVHWEVHIPPVCIEQFTSELWRWVERTTGGIIDGNAILVKPLEAPANGYLLKGARPLACQLYGRGRKHEVQGIIIGRRAAASRNLGPKARRAMDRALNIRRRLPSLGAKQQMIQPSRPAAHF